MKAFVTGAAGFIGSFLCRDLLARGIEVTAFAMPGENIQLLKDRGIAVRVGDLTDAKSLKGCCDGMDIIFHLAARVRDWGPRQAFYAATYDTTQNLLEEAAGKVSRFVYVSSIAACGLGRHLKGHKESDPCFKSGVPYNDSKLDTEALIRDFASKKDLMFTIIRPANVIGPGSVWVWDILDHLRTLMSVPLMDGGRYSASLVYVENLTDGIVKAGTADAAKGQIYQFRDDWNVTWKQYLTDLGAMIGKKPGLPVPFLVAWWGGTVMEAVLTPLGIRPPVTRLAASVLGRDNDVDNTKAKTEIGWQTFTPYDEAMARIRNWVTNVYMKSLK
ncbi:MAG: NAD-dependent epimerase/dehydratase family protein [Syntrophales bacterium]|jgi:dihydroflavonol-4-reductase